jgi:lipoprotein-anchoring transpeptidase ErfK/SrfK
MVSRREFLKFSSLSFGSLLFGGIPLPDGELVDPQPRGRITISSIFLHAEPNINSKKLGSVYRDEIVYIKEQVTNPTSPKHNQRWYHLDEGYIYSAYVQRIDEAHSNLILKTIPEGGQLAEVTVPYTRSYLRTQRKQWKPMYRLYYGSIYWITDIIHRLDGETWYELTDDLLHVRLGVRARDLRPISADEMTPLSPETPTKKKRIQVILEDQRMTCYEEDDVVYQATVSTGMPGNADLDIYTDTPTGRFYVQSKFPSRHMGDGKLTSSLSAYELPGVPWVSFFHKLGYGFHGTYWHDNFGRKMSHGCINMRNRDALWLYRWTQPLANHSDWFIRGVGTRVDII